MNDGISLGQQLLKQYLSILTDKAPIENYRPDWLHGLELDYYYPDAKVAFEFNGGQHYYNSTFGEPWKQRENDIKKQRLCKLLDIKLIVVEASELTAIKMYHKTKLSGIVTKKNHKEFWMSKQDELKEFEKQGKAYMKMLIKTYNCPTAMKPLSDKKMKAVKKNNNGMVLFSTTDEKKLRKKYFDDKRAENKRRRLNPGKTIKELIGDRTANSLAELRAIKEKNKLLSKE